MKRYVPIAAIAIAVAFPAVAAKAMPGHGGEGSTLAGRIQLDMSAPHHVSLAFFKRDAHGVHRIAQVRGSTGMSGGGVLRFVTGRISSGREASHLRANLSAADLTVTSVDNVTANSQSSPAANAGPFANFHSAYSGFQSATSSEWDGSNITFWYQGSVFVNSTAAFAYSQVGAEQAETADDTGGAQVCSYNNMSTLDQPFCQVIGYAASNNEQGYYAVASVDHCSVEAGVQGNANYISNNFNGVNGFLNDIFNAGLNAALAACAGIGTPVQVPTIVPPTVRPTSPAVTIATNTPVPPTNTPVPTATPTTVSVQFSIIKVRWEKNASKPQPKAKPLKSIKVKRKAQIVVYFQVTNAPANEPATVDFGVFKGKKQIAGGSQNGHLSSPAAGNYAVGEHWKVAAKPGKYKGIVRVTIGGMVAQAGSVLKVTR